MPSAVTATHPAATASPVDENRAMVVSADSNKNLIAFPLKVRVANGTLLTLEIGLVGSLTWNSTPLTWVNGQPPGVTVSVNGGILTLTETNQNSAKEPVLYPFTLNATYSGSLEPLPLIADPTIINVGTGG